MEGLSPEDAEAAVQVAESRLAAAEVEASRAEVLARLLKQQRLAYAAIPEDPEGVHLVAYCGQLLGQVWSTTSGPIGDWYARPEGDETRSGPYHTARAAAASLVADRSVTRQED